MAWPRHVGNSRQIVVNAIGQQGKYPLLVVGSDPALCRCFTTHAVEKHAVGEYAFQIRIKNRKEFALDAMTRVEAFFVGLRYAAQDAAALDATKTGIVYRLYGNAPAPHE